MVAMRTELITYLTDGSLDSTYTTTVSVGTRLVLDKKTTMN